MWQAEHIVAALRERNPGAEFELVVIRTTGDQRQDVPLRQIGDKSLFIKEIEAALLNGGIDFAVHSLKDVPSLLDGRFTLAAILEREDPRDVLLAREGGGLGALAEGARVGTGSLRREAQLRAVRPDLRFEPVRGNVDTRLRKLKAGEFDGIVLAAAGLRRLGVPIPQEAFLDPEVCLPSPGQAAICVEVLAGNDAAAGFVSGIDHPATRRAVEAERAFAAELDAGCRVPVGAYAIPSSPAAGEGMGEGPLTLQGLVASEDGRRVIKLAGRGHDPAELGRRLAREALAQGAAALLQPA
jgi:hydroxymethylbilane synthase